MQTGFLFPQQNFSQLPFFCTTTIWRQVQGFYTSFWSSRFLGNVQERNTECIPFHDTSYHNNSILQSAWTEITCYQMVPVGQYHCSRQLDCMDLCVCEWHSLQTFGLQLLAAQMYKFPTCLWFPSLHCSTAWPHIKLQVHHPGCAPSQAVELVGYQ